jgi:hypothetical protein
MYLTPKQICCFFNDYFYNRKIKYNDGFAFFFYQPVSGTALF